jgi:L-histidine N-alpha-methyltransferase
LASSTAGLPTTCRRIFSFFGMLPNFEPEVILRRMGKLIAAGDHLLLSANLAPGNDYAQGVKRILPLYDNDLTRDWLMTFLLDIGVEKSDGELRFVIEDKREPVHLKRIAAYFNFARSRVIELDSQRFEFRDSESLRLFFSYRHTPALLRALLGPVGLEVVQQWIISSAEEGVFLVKRTNQPASTF